jgi:hypothetical protein
MSVGIPTGRGRLKTVPPLPIVTIMTSSERTERRRAAADRRKLPRPIRCMHCGVLLTYERRGSIVRLYGNGTAVPLPASDIAEPNPSATTPRCVVCSEPLVPLAAEAVEQQRAG